ncbi:MAG: hypothetical protein B7X08_03985 [Acidocella sp. 20-63-7]|nr:MAG: hypothetical protein B7X08_03985 [Acidocella sp. 20-63-7]HQT46546.1 SRPBCC family protein [Acidocella sp.]
MRACFLPLALLSLTGCHHRYTGPSAALAALAAQGQTDAQAPLQTSQQITISAPPAKVWALLSDIQSWPDWHPKITQVAVGAVQQGSPFSWTLQGMSINSTIEAFNPPQRLAFTGDVLNFHAIYVWTLTPGANGTTQVNLNESVDGFLVSLFYSDADMADAAQSWLTDLNAAADKP